MDTANNNYVSKSFLEKTDVETLSIKNAFDSFKYDDNFLKKVYIKEVEHACEFFNNNILPCLLKNLLPLVKQSAKKVENSRNMYIVNQIIEANASKDYSSFYMHSSFFDYEFSLTYKRHASFVRLRESSSEFKVSVINSLSFKDLVSRINSCHQMHFDCSFIHFRSNFHEFITDTLLHELSHAIVFLYITSLTCAILGKPQKVMTHGKEWKAVASSMGATPEACVKYKTKEDANNSKKDIDIILKFYKSMDDIRHLTKRYPIARKKTIYLYECSCNSHDFSPKRHKKSQNGEMYLCRKCDEIVKYTGKKTATY